MSLAAEMARAPRLLPAPVPSSSWAEEAGGATGSRSTVNGCKGDGAGALDALRAEAESLAKIRRDLGGNRRSPAAPPASAGKLVTSSASSSRPGSKRGMSGVETTAAPPPVAPWDVPASTSSMARPSIGNDELSNSVVPNNSPRISPRNNDSSLSNGLARQHMERRQLIEWGENLYQEVGKLEQEKDRVGRSLAESEIAKQKLDLELDQMRSRCKDLERLVRSGDTSSSNSAEMQQENAELRKQLAAYAVEIDVLREEREVGQNALRESQEAVQHLTIERDGFVRSLQEVERSHHDKEKHCQQLETILNTHGDEKMKLEGELHKTMSELGVVGSSLQLIQEQGTDTHRHAELAVAEAERVAHEKDQRIVALVDVIQPLRDQLTTLQDNYVKQTREFGTFIQKVRQRQQLAEQTINTAGQSIQEHMKDAEELPRLLQQLTEASKGWEQGNQASLSAMHKSQKDLQSELDQTKEHHKQTREEQRRLQSDLQRQGSEEKRKRDTRKARLKQRFNMNICASMAKACHNANLLMKVNEKGNKKEYRRVIVDEDSMRLKWVKHPYNFGRGESYVELDRIIFICFGCRTRASTLFPASRKDGVVPWRCFSVYTVDRSYDFICRDEEEAECYVLSISRLCARLTGWSIPGSMHTHAQFVCATAWCKVENLCRLERKTLPAALVDALSQAARKTAARSTSPASVRGGSGGPSAAGRTASPVPSNAVADIGAGVGIALPSVSPRK